MAAVHFSDNLDDATYATQKDIADFKRHLMIAGEGVVSLHRLQLIS
ncbi:hypothetical protein H1230_16965 [Paenibacillus sp. 19GGS1-52]|nr:hypothetical protein [Paenibacillus sp. 19GGS1-52]ULO04837.1 hypothetical protein H1230_16965 [Paenibacillus sp. 19GGS1-52]